MDDQITEFRAFSRFYTRQIGLLNEHFNDSRFSLPEGRVLHEIAARGHTTPAAVARTLDMDPGYASRLLRKLVDEELVALSPNPADRRSNHIALTPEGDAAYAQLDGAHGGETLSQGTVVLRPHRIGELGWLIHRQGLLYNQQFGWNSDFEALIAGIYSEYEAAPATPPKSLWVAERDGTIAGSIFCMPSADFEGAAQLRMLYVEPEARGLGIGQTLVDQCVRFARDSGYQRIRLWTHAIQQAARRCYARAGFEIVEEWDHESFGKQLHAEIWELRF